MALTAHREAVSVQPAIEPLTIEDARMHCDLDDAYHDGSLSRLITAARVKVEQDTRLALINQTRVMKFDAWPRQTIIELPVAPLQSVSSVTYVDTLDSTQTLSASLYAVDTTQNPGRRVLNDGESWPATRGHYNDIVVTYIAGHGATVASVPKTAQLAMLMLVRHWFDRGTAVSQDFAQPQVMPLAYQSMVNSLHWGQYP